ncbi:MAG TPA: endonuclease/exonuclease/phosphatase family protein [Micromonosporaceae bacterium]|nr:endonuclease/exonuclease/phosphatase family protein [Micromonosporaceae bacterium]
MHAFAGRAAGRRSHGGGRFLGTAIWAGAVASAGWAAVRAGGLERGVPAVQVMAFTPYAAAGSVVPLGAALATRRWGAALLTAGATATLATSVLPRALRARTGRTANEEPDHPGRPLRVMTANLLHGDADPAGIVRLVRQERVDLLAMQEYTPQAECGLLDAGLAAALPHRVSRPAPGGHGSALYSRYPLRDTGVRWAATGFGQVLAMLEVPQAYPVDVTSVHLSSPADVARTRDWAADLANQPGADPAGPVRLMLGDFNATLDHALLRKLLRSGYADAADTAGAGLAPTWPYRQWFVPRVTLDHVLVDTRIRVGRVSAHRVPGSDHRALIADLILPASRRANQPAAAGRSVGWSAQARS